MSLTITTDNQAVKFKKHLDAERNERIIFTGAFGVGKTYFLQQFFREQDSNYLAIRLAPVNYSVSSTEDIFQLIKYDILFELMAKHGVTLEAEAISRSIAYPTLLPARLNGLLQGLVGMVPLLNKDNSFIEPVVKGINAAYDAIEEIEKQRKDPNLTKPVLDFAERIAATSLLEMDYITTFIENSLNDVQREKGAGSKVLIIDDLDRIDPEHIFRLFNIFSAHLDYNSTSNNKFGFDKVVFVCDIHNIRTIFHSRYGADTDFNGYIDKFYSLDMYHFDNRAEVRRIVSEFVSRINLPENYKRFFESVVLVKHRSRMRAQLNLILEELVHAGGVKVRRLATTHGFVFDFSERAFRLGATGREIQNWQVPIVIILDMLRVILGGIWALEAGLRKLAAFEKSPEFTNDSRGHHDYLVGNLLPVLGFDTHQMKCSNSNVGEPAYEYVNEQTKQRIGYSLIETGDRRDQYYATVTRVNGAPHHEQDLEYFQLLYRTFQRLQEINYFK